MTKRIKARLREKNKRINYSKIESMIGVGTNLFDRFGREICNGDIVRTRNKDAVYTGRVLYNREEQCYDLYFGCWYGDNAYDTESYGKIIHIPADNGMRMHLEILNKDQEERGRIDK